MQMNFETYKDKVLGCFMGKNIGGTLGGPFEGRRGIFDVDFYTHDITGEPLPNDDLDLQLAWLCAAEKFGKGVNASILGEYWNTYIMPNWSEYGAGKNNLRAGIVPPLSGYVNNIYRDSCGAFIRSEIWACLCPGQPAKAARYAYEDAIVDHSGEGVYGEVFCAALESAAFVESDAFKLIDIALSYIPKDCATARGINIVLNCYKNGEDWKKARQKALTEVPGSFCWGKPGLTEGNEVPMGALGFDAPGNVALTVLAFLYGEGDIGKSVCHAVNCGEDADCSAATVGSILGIINGLSNIPEKWVAPIGRGIVTICLNVGDKDTNFPRTIDEMAERILRLAPTFLGSESCDLFYDGPGYLVNLPEADALYAGDVGRNGFARHDFKDELYLDPFCVRSEGVLFDSVFDYGGEPFVEEGAAKNFVLTIDNNVFAQQWLNIKWHLPEEWEISPGRERSVPLEQFHSNDGRISLKYEVIPREMTKACYDLVIEISSNARHTKAFIPVVLYAK